MASLAGMQVLRRTAAIMFCQLKNGQNRLVRFYGQTSELPAIFCSEKYIPRRAVLYVPGSDKKKLEKIPSLDVDCAVMDCEDGVALNRKEVARHNISEMLDVLDFGRTECVVRVNSACSGLMVEDLKVILKARTLPMTLMLPKVQRKEEIDLFTQRLLDVLGDRRTERKFNLITFVESAMGLMNLKEICKRAFELSLKHKLFLHDGIVFGSDDFCADIGATRTRDAMELLYARQKVVVCAKAFGLQAIDLVYIDYKDLEGLEKQSKEGARMGFTGKQVIHPAQIPVVQNAFSPTTEKVEWASELIKAFSEHHESGKGAFTFRGDMIDMPLVLQARHIVQLSRAVGGI